MSKTELFVGNLDQNIQRTDIENVFEKYGKILRCDIKNKGKGKKIKKKRTCWRQYLIIFLLKKKGMGPSFCFLEFEDEKIAEVKNK
jgi:RNA recognition motif-containing protein